MKKFTPRDFYFFLNSQLDQRDSLILDYFVDITICHLHCLTSMCGLGVTYNLGVQGGGNQDNIYLWNMLGCRKTQRK